MNGIDWVRRTAHAVLLVAGLCATSCRSHFEAAFAECVAERRPGCAVELASMEAERRPSCCACKARLGFAQKENAMARREALSPSEFVEALRQAAVHYEEAAMMCPRRSNAYASAANDAMAFYRQVAEDENPSQWIAITEIEDRDRRIDAVIAHATFYGDRCQHGVQKQHEFAVYLSAMASAPTYEIRRRLPFMATSPLAGDLFQLYFARRSDELPQVADSELVLEQIRIELYSTPYKAVAEKALAAKAAASDDPFKVDRICRSLGPGADREMCQSHAQDLWSKAIGGAPVRQLIEICPRLESLEMRARCQGALAEEALKLVAEDASVEDLELAETATRNADVKYRREWRIRLLRRDAERNFNRIVNQEPELQVELAESVGAWKEFVDVFDTLARKVSDNREESLRSIHPELVRRIDKRKSVLAGRARELYQRRASDCRVAEKRLRRKDDSVKLDAVRRCFADLARVLTIDETHLRAQKLLNDLEDSAATQNVNQHTEWTTVVVPLLLAEALRGFVPPALTRVMFRAAQTLDF